MPGPLALLGTALALLSYPGASHSTRLLGGASAVLEDTLDPDILHFAVNSHELRSNGAFARRPVEVSSIVTLQRQH